MGSRVFSREDLLKFALEREKTQFKDFSEFCNNGDSSSGASKVSRQTMSNWIKELVKEGYLARDLANGDKYPHYYIPREKVDEVKKKIEDYLIAQGIEGLSDGERKKILSKMLGEDQNKILSAIGQNGAINILEIAQITGFTELKVEETIRGPMLYADTVSAQEYRLPVKFRKYGLTVLGLYRALRIDVANFDVIVKNWGHLHPFIFSRLLLFREYGLEPALKEFISILWLEPSTAEENEERLRRIEKYLISFLISGYSYKYLHNWFKLIHNDQEFLERVKACFQGYIDAFQQDIVCFQHGLETINMLSHRKPNWEEIKWRENVLGGLERFMHFKEIDWDQYLERSQ